MPLHEWARAPVFIEHFMGWTGDTSQDPPHRHDYQELLWFRAGTGRHVVDSVTERVEGGTFSLVARGQVHTFLETHDLTGFTVCFTDDFLPSGVWNPALLFNTPGPMRTFRAQEDEDAFACRLLGLLLLEYERESGAAHFTVLRPLLIALLHHVERILTVCDQAQGVEATLARAFLELLERDFKVRHNVAHYARQLGAHPDRLARDVAGSLGRSPKEVILDRVLLEARRMLQFTGLSVKEIAGELGFRDPYHFGRLFKQASGLPPLTFRERHRN